MRRSWHFEEGRAAKPCSSLRVGMDVPHPSSAHEEELAREADLFGDDGVVCIEIPDAPTNVLLVQFEPHS